MENIDYSVTDDQKHALKEDGIRDRSPSRGLGDVYKRQKEISSSLLLILVKEAIGP